MSSSLGFYRTENGFRLTRIARDKVCQLPAQGRWFSQDTPASSISKTDRRDMTEIVERALYPNQKTKNKKLIDQINSRAGIKTFNEWLLQSCLMT